MTMNALARHFDALFEADADPWRYRTSWYESRKRAVLLAALPHARYRRAFEPGCAAGELSAQLAKRCDRLLASDASATAVARARGRLASFANIQLECARMPRDWPSGDFDLIVVSELGYYLADAELDRVIAASAQSLAKDGVLVACHWRHPADDLLRSGDEVHARFAAGCGLPQLVRHAEPDFLLDVWAPSLSSVARLEGLA